MITRSGQKINVSWEAGKAWEILQDVKFQDIKTAQAHGERGTLLLLYLTAYNCSATHMDHVVKCLCSKYVSYESILNEDLTSQASQHSRPVS